MQIQSRKSAGLPPVPSSVGHRSLSSWTGIKVHHTGGVFSSWRSIYDWQVHNRPASQRLVDVGYSFGVAGGRVTELRGWRHHPAHDHENSTLGVVFGGNFTSRLPPDEDLDAFVEFVRYAREHTGRPLPVTGHRDTWPRGDGRYSTCPGDRLYGHLPQLRQRIDEEDDMTPAQLLDTSMRYPGSKDNVTVETALKFGMYHSGRARHYAYEAATGVEAILAAIAGQDVAQTFRAELKRHREEFVTELSPRLADSLVDELRPALGEVSRETVEQAVRNVLGSLDEDDGDALPVADGS